MVNDVSAKEIKNSSSNGSGYKFHAEHGGTPYKC